MERSPKHLFLFTALSFIIFLGISTVAFNEKSLRSLSSIESSEDILETPTLTPTQVGDLCADAIEEIQIEKNWQTDSNVTKNIESAFTICLSEYIKIKTISPIGDEHKAVEFFEQIFSRLNYPYKTFEVEDLTGSNETRVNLIATLPYNLKQDYDWSLKQEKKSIILLNHMDVVDAIESQWESPDLVWSGKVAPSKSEPEEKFIWGRGALDMKSIAITQLLTMQLLKLQGIELDRDIHFLAVADEEQSGSGAIGAIRKMPKGEELHALTDTAIILGEGGGAVSGLPSEKWNLFLLAVEEKGGAWMEVENNSIPNLLKNLNKSKIIDIRKYLKRGDKQQDKDLKRHQCTLVEVETPKAKVNVVASKIIVKLKCNDNQKNRARFEKAFTKRFKSVKVNTKKVDDLEVITIETSSASHGSLGINESALDAFAVGMHRLGFVKLKRKVGTPKFFRYVRTAATKLFVRTLSKSNFLLRLVKRLQFLPFIKNLVLSEVEDQFGIEGLFKTTCQFSAVSFSTKAQALVDCRLIHTAKKFPHSHNHAGDFREQLLNFIKDPDLNINIMDGWNVSQSSVKSKDFKKILKSLKKLGRKSGSNQKVMVAPYLFPAGSDNTWFRNPWSAGVEDIESIPTYGFFPAYLTPELLATFHGSNERFPIKEIQGTVVRYEAVINSLAQKKKNIIQRVLKRDK